MTIFLIILAVFVGLGLAATAATMTLKVIDASMSQPAHRIMKLYNQVPESSRPYGNIKEMLKALDLKHGINEVNKHYSNTSRTYDGLSTKFAWHPSNCYQHAQKCEYKEYVNIASALEDIIDAYKRQERALEIAGVQNNLDLIEQFTQAANDERKIIDSVTKELGS